VDCPSTSPKASEDWSIRRARSEGGVAGLDGVGVALVVLERLAAVAEELCEGDGAERHGVEVLQVGGRRLRHQVQLPQKGGPRRVCQ
jgi:hypothetical protein